MAEKTFKQGVPAPELKRLTRGEAILDAPLPEKVVLPLQESPGDPASPLVKKGDIVTAGQKIAEAQGPWGLPVWASIAGKVTHVGDTRLVNGRMGPAITISAEGEEQAEAMPGLGEDIGAMDPGAIKERIKEAGIMGMGGAAFPTHIKLSPPEGTKIDTLIINGAECEPYLTCDEKVMESRPQDIVQGLLILMQASGAQKGIIGVKSHKKKAIDGLVEAAREYGQINVESLEDKYPQGAEKMLVYALLGREVPKGGLPFQVGVLVNNVQTAVAIKEAVKDGLPLTRRVITVTGPGMQTPKDIKIFAGTLAQDIIELAGGLKENAGKFIAGGPMMGIAQHYLDYPVGRGQSAILVLSEDESHMPVELSCIRCARCVDNCPMFLNPTTLAAYAEKEKVEFLEKGNIMECIECGTCSFVCPAKKNLVQNIVLGKNLLRAFRQKNSGGDKK